VDDDAQVDGGRATHAGAARATVGIGLATTAEEAAQQRAEQAQAAREQAADADAAAQEAEAAKVRATEDAPGAAQAGADDADHIAVLERLDGRVPEREARRHDRV